MSEIEWRGQKYDSVEILNQPKSVDSQEKAIKLNQCSKVLQQGGNNTVNINYQVNFVKSVPLENIQFQQNEGIDVEAFLAFVNTFPHPRYRHFFDWLKQRAIEKCFGNKLQAAKWLGVCERTLRRSMIRAEDV